MVIVKRPSEDINLHVSFSIGNGLATVFNIVGVNIY